MWKRNFKYYIITAGDNMTKYYDLAKDNKEIAIKKAAHVIKTGGLVLFPTETVYGIGGYGLSEENIHC